ncbi:hypothetical protein VTK73DRAFT_789 [Phialemonium thermophilum]|uniref:DUF3835 domain-containing protein n=1 Tax=Phialemonium thermophilum TaxID=223376 RepID=A0ABR3VUB9_9PEZI
MAQARARDITEDLERHRQVLEDTVSRLRSSLLHWQQWYLEYSALKEEVEAAESRPPPSRREDLARIRRDFEGELLDRKEVGEILGKHDLREPAQVLTTLARRLEYVERNVEALRKQLTAAEDRLAASNVVARPDGGTDEESGLPITDIIEELDEEGNVVSFRLQSGADSGAKVLEALEKAGVDEVVADEKGGGAIKTTGPETARDGSASKPRGDQAVEACSEKATATSEKLQNTSAAKSVSFSDDTKPGHEIPQQPMSRAARRLETIMRDAKEQEKMDISSAVIPEDESPEDAQLRREMLEYGMSEIGPVVAELQLDDDGTDDEEEDFTEDEEGDDDDDDDIDDEDELGRYKYSVITDDYRRRMQELEKRLGVQSAFAARPMDATPVPEGQVGRISVVREPSSQTQPPAPGAEPVTHGEAKPQPAPKKGVRFAEQLDIAPDGPAAAEVKPPHKKEEVNPLSDVVERTAQKPVASEKTPKRTSRFKKERHSDAQPAAPSAVTGPLNVPVRFLDEERPAAPAGPEGKTVADVVLERETPSAVREPDELDSTLLQQEAAVEYHRMRNRLIQKQGGFLREESEEAVAPLDDDEGGPRRMSKFKAARLSRR